MRGLAAVRGFVRRAVFPADERALVLLSAIFVASRAAAVFAGVRFDATDLSSFWHFAPQHLLETRLAETVFYLHFQPPLFNLYLGCVLGAFGSSATAAFGASFLLLGLATALGLYVFMRRIGVGARVALALTSLFALCPSTLLFENYLFYELPVAALLVFSALAFHVALTSGSARAWATFFSFIAALVLTRALFHPVVLLLSALGPAAAFARHRRALLMGFALPAALVFGVCLKNWVLFDAFGTSSWLGMGLARMTLRNIDAETKIAWAREGAVSKVALVHPPSALSAYANVMRLPENTGIPVLDEPQKPAGALNLHHLAYARISRVLLADDWVALRREPAVYARTAGAAFERFFRPATTWQPLAKNRRPLALFDRVYNAIFHFGERGGPMFVLFLGSLAFGLVCAFRRDLTREKRGVFALLASTMGYVLLSGTLLEPLENMRFRYAVEPYVWTLVGLSVAFMRRPKASLSR
jgi:hypothetical protein